MKKPAQGARRRSEKLEPRQMLAADLGTELNQIDNLDESLGFVIADVAPIDGAGNNAENPGWGATAIELLRLTTVEYADGYSEPGGEDRPSAREISNAVADQDTLTSNDRYLTDFVWIWGQFIDHDIDLSTEADPEETLPIDVPAGDPEFDPFATGAVTINLDRSDYVVDEAGVRQQLNTITGYIDGSVVYGSDEATATSLRTFDGGRLLTSEGDLLPLGEDGFFLAGDVRANENVALTSMHTLWVREHNRLADQIAESDASLTDEQVYQQARALVTAQIQAITYNQWLPALLGVDAIAAYEGYDPTVNASIANVFSTAAFRFGHSMLSTELLRLNADGSTADEGNLSLADAFFSPGEILTHGIDSLLLGASAQVAQEIDSMIVDDVRNFLFGPPGAGGLDLASLNIQRGRDHGLADYNQTREDYGLARVTSFAQITSDEELAAKLEALYGSVDQIDPWIGVLAEDHAAGASLGELGRTILIDQFTRQRDGDRYWYENRFEGETLDALQVTTLADVLQRNTTIDGLRPNVFFDESVLYYAAEPDAPRLNAMLIAQRGELRLFDVPTGRLLAAVPSDAASMVSLVGTDRSDRVLVHPSALALDLPGGIIIDGQAGRHDALIVMTKQLDRPGPVVRPRIDTDRSPTVDETFAQIEDTAIQLSDVEHLLISLDDNNQPNPSRPDRNSHHRQTPNPHPDRHEAPLGRDVRTALERQDARLRG